MLDGEEPKPMHPWYKNFRGTIERFSDKYVISGEVAILPGDKVEITELPIGSWTQNYKENVLEPLLGTEKVKPVISEYRVSGFCVWETIILAFMDSPFRYIHDAVFFLFVSEDLLLE